MKKDLAGRSALVTGGSRGIGFDIASTLSNCGAKVAIVSRDPKSVASACAKIQEGGGFCRGYVADSSDAAQVADAIKAIKKDFGGLDILVNNIGGVRQFSNFEGLSDSDWGEVFEVNVMSMVRFTREVFPLLKKSKHARVINIASVAGKRPGNFNPHYGAMKAAMIHLSKYLSNQWGKNGICVNAICPHTVKGGVWSRDVANKARMMGVSKKIAEKAMFEEIAGRVPLHDIARPEDVADLVAYLASDKARFITGTCIAVDGGAVNSIF